MDNIINGLSIVATPIGNLDDITYRAVKILGECDIIICENPKHSLKLLNKLGIKKKLISMHDYNEKQIIDKIKSDLSNKICVLISDAGAPLISDPGYKLIQYCCENNIFMTSVPGPSSIIPALQLSGLDINEFYFAGFAPKTAVQMEKFVANINLTKITIVFFVSSHKIKMFLDLMNKLSADKKLSVCKELTKLNEKIFRGNVYDVRNKILKNNKNLKGEFVVIVEGNSSKKMEFFDLKEHNNIINKMLINFSLTDVVEIVHKLTKIPKNKVYKWVLKLKKS